MTDFARAVRLWRRDYRAAAHDLLGLTVLTPDQERHFDLLGRHRRVAAMGGTGTGKSFAQGTVALLQSLLDPGKTLFGGPKLDQAARLSWLEFQRAHDQLAAYSGDPGGRLGSYEWRGPARDNFAVVMALSDRNNAASVKGMLHAARATVVMDELEGVADDCANALDDGTTQDNSHYWFAFNPVNPDSAAGRFWLSTPPEARVQLSALACAEWQERTGNRVPGMPTLAAIEAKWRGRENEPGYYASVLGEFPPASADWVVLPKPWFDACVGEFVPGQPVGIGVDTAGGRSENVVAVCAGESCAVSWASREQHQTPLLVARVKGVANRYGGRAVPIAVDVVGQGGKGVADDLRADGYNALDFVGGGREFAGRRDPSALTADVITWAWFEVRDAARRRVETGAGLTLPDDPTLREQFARRYRVAADRAYKLESKDSTASPDRADAVAMAWLAAHRPTPRVGLHILGG